MPFDLIIWDCDGCLVDSELIACGLAAEMLAAWGYPITVQDFIDRFAGMNTSQIEEALRKETGRKFDGYKNADYMPRLKEAFSKSLKVVPGVHDILQGLSCKHCVASGSAAERVEHALKVTRLWPFFEGKVFNSLQVKKGKPAPDVFLFAAQSMGVAPDRCLVIEDSVYGIQAAKAAGMRVFAFLGGSHVNDAWRARVEAEKPDAIFDDMAQLPEMMEDGA